MNNLEDLSKKQESPICCESATCFKFNNLITKVKSEIKNKYPTIDDEKFRGIVYQSLKKFTINGQYFDYISQGNYLGGFRWFVKCPGCGKRRTKLYLPDKYPEKEQKYMCKDCHGLKNSSSIMGASRRYKKVIRPLKKLDSIKAKLLNKNININKSKKLLAEYEKIERELKSSPEYKLWEFQKRHGVE